MDDDRYVSPDELAEIMRVKKPGLRAAVRRGDIPRPDVHLTSRRKGWKRSTLQARGIPIPLYPERLEE